MVFSRTTKLRDVSLKLNCRFNVAEHYAAVRLSQDVHDNLPVHERSDYVINGLADAKRAHRMAFDRDLEPVLIKVNRS
jgi:hypothetical protein